MRRTGEHIHRRGADGAIPLLCKQLHIPGQGRRITGDVDDTLRRHRCRCGDHLRAEPLAGRVHAYHVRAQAPGGEVRRGRRRVAAEKLHISDAVAFCVFFGIGNGLRHDLRADDPRRPPGHHLGDGARAAVQVQHRLVPSQSREVRSGIVQHLRHVMVHLIKGRHAQPEGQAAQGILQHVRAPQGAVFTAQYSPGGLGVHAQHHAHGIRQRLPHKRHQRVLARQLPPVDQHADQ